MGAMGLGAMRRLAGVAIACAALAVGALQAEAGAPAEPCGGDCNGDGRVSVGEIVTAVGIALGSRPIGDCAAADADSSGDVEIGELVGAVGNALDGCGQGDAVFLIRACAAPEDPDGQTFRVLIRDAATIAEAESLIGAGQALIVSGRLLAGDGGFNAPWSWHHDPATIEFADFTIELCDGCPRFVEEDLDYWLDVVGTYCPWSTEVLRRVR